MTYARIVDGIISTVDTGDTLPKGCIETKKLLQTGLPFSHFNKSGDLKPLSQLVAEKLIEVPEGSKLDGETIREMTEVELIEDGQKEKPKGMKIENDKLVAMTLDEQLKAKEITQEEYKEQFNENIKRQIRAIEDTDTYRRKMLLVTIGDATNEDIAWLKSKEAEKQALREKLK